MIAYRIQDKSRGVEYLLDPETQYSWPMNDDESLVRHGVSGSKKITENSLLRCCIGPQSVLS